MIKAIAAHLHLHMHVKNFLSSNSQMYMIYIVFNSCPVYKMIQNATVVLKFTKDEKKNLLRKINARR